MSKAKADVIDGAVHREQEAQAQLLEEAGATVRTVALRGVCLDGKLQATVCDSVNQAHECHDDERLERRGSSALQL